MGREERERPTAVPRSPGRGLCSPLRAAQRAAPTSPGHGRGREVVLRAPAAVRRGWGGARAGRRPERGVGQPEGGPAAPATSHCLQTARCRAEGSIEQSEAGASATGPRRPVWSGSAAAHGQVASGTLVTAARSRELQEDAAQTEGAARRCAPSLSLSLGETNLLSGSQLSNLPIMILA